MLSGFINFTVRLITVCIYMKSSNERYGYQMVTYLVMP
jgi:hypothetical protein